MRSNRLVIPLIVVVLAALAGAYWLGRSQPHASQGDAESSALAVPADRRARSTQPGLRNGSRARGYFAELKIAADGGDLAASTRLYRNLDLCHRLRSAAWSNAVLAGELLDTQTRGMSAAQLENYRAQLDGIESRRQNARRMSELCDGADAATLDSLVPSLHQAAQLGEPYARACYLAMGPGLDMRALARHPEWIDTYRTSVPGMVEAGLAAGDWAMVNVLRTALQPGAEGLLGGALDADPVQHFRYLKLYRLGAGAGDIAVLDQQLAVAAARLSPQQRAEAETWADTTFRRDFGGRPSAGAPGLDRDPCVFPHE